MGRINKGQTRRIEALGAAALGCDLSPREVVVVRGGALGDCLVSLPSLKLLREHFPDARITLVGCPYSGPIFRSCSSIDRLVLVDHYGNRTGYIRDLLRLRKERPHLLIDLQDSGRSRLQTALIWGQVRIGLNTRTEVARAIYTHRVPLDKSVHVTRRISNVLEPLGINPRENILHAQLELGDADRELADEVLRRNGIEGSFAFLQVTTGPRESYRIWPPERFAAAAEFLYNKGFQVVIASTVAHETVREVVAKAACPVNLIEDRLDTLVLAGIIERAQIYVGYNTGPMHIAAALGVRIAALFDVPNDFVEWYPATAAPCRILQAKSCDEPPGWRLDTIALDEVLLAVGELADTPELNAARA